MNRFWARRRDGYKIEVRGALDNEEQRFAVDQRGDLDGRYALEWAIDLLSRSESVRADGQSLKASSTP